MFTCIFNCVKKDKDLTKLKNEESWKSLLDVAVNKNYLPITTLSDNLEVGELPCIYYHRECRSLFMLKEKATKSVIDSTLPSSSRQSIRGKTKHILHSDNKNVFSNVCIFCEKASKYKKKSKTRENLTSCCELRADEKIRILAQEKNDERIIAISTDELIAKEAKYHKSCYRDYTREFYREKIINIEQSEKDEYIGVKEVLFELRDHPDLIEYAKLTSVAETAMRKNGETDDSVILNFKKNLRRKIESSLNGFHFITIDRKTYVYPNTLTLEELIIRFVKVNNELINIKKMSDDHQNVVHVGRLIRKEVKNVNNAIPWPPKPKDLEVKNFKVSEYLNIFMNVLLGNNIDCISDRVERLKLSFSQDITYAVTNGSVKTPKSILYPYHIKSLTNNTELINITARLGHGVSYSFLQELITETAFEKIEGIPEDFVVLPENCTKSVFTIEVDDNIDRNEETLSGLGTTHKVNSILIQPGSFNEVELSSVVAGPSEKKKARRSFNITSKELVAEHIPGKRIGPTRMEYYTNEERSILFHKQNILYFVWILARNRAISVNLPQQIPNWTGFHIKLRERNTVIQSSIGYLDCLDAPATDMSTIYYLLCRSLRIKEQLELPSLVCVYDQAIFAKAIEIKFKEKEKFKDLVLLMGTFHTLMMFLGIIGHRFKDAGLKDILVYSGVFAEGSVNGVLTGKSYNRAVRSHKLVFEAITRLLLEKMDEKLGNLNAIFQHIPSLWSEENYNNFIYLEEFNTLYNDYESFCNNISNENPLSSFWLSYLDMVKKLLNLIYSTRAGLWHLYLESIRSLLPWTFAYDRYNYARYLTFHFVDMLSLQNTHPEVYHEFINGNFTVQISSSNTFGRVEADKTIETTINRDSKTPGGTTGFSVSHGAVQRWTLNSSYRASVRKLIHQLVNYRKSDTLHRDLLPSSISRDEKDIQCIMDVISENFVNPFSADQLISITSGIVADTATENDLLHAEETGKRCMQQFIDERLTGNQNAGFYDPLKKQRLRTFTNMVKQHKVKINEKVVELTAERNVFARICIVSQQRNIDLKEVFSYPLGPFPWALSGPFGELNKTNKSTLMHELEKGSELIDFIPNPYCSVFDGMALVRKITPSGLTFEDYSIKLIEAVLSMSKYACRIDVVFDVYHENSIKNAERARRVSGNIEYSRIIGNQKIRQWNAFLSSAVNKTEFVKFLVTQWVRIIPSYKQTIFVTSGKDCWKLTPENSVKVPDLFTSQEEADTRIFLHCKHASEEVDNIVIHTPDTDVFVIGLAIQSEIKANVFIKTGIKNKLRLISMSNIIETVFQRFNKWNIPKKKLMHAILGLHGFTGCDTVSSFSGKGKIKALKLLTTQKDYIETFFRLGTSWDINSESFIILERFVCDLYGSQQDGVNLLRYKKYCANQGKIDAKNLPPCFDSLKHHCLRANYQVAVWRRCLDMLPDIPSPDGNGWLINENGIDIHWNDLKPAPEEVLQLLSCECSRKCIKNSCLCLDNGFNCTHACKLKSCDNMMEDSGDIYLTDKEMCEYYSDSDTDEDFM